MDQQEKPYKIIIVGGLKSGKTSFFRRWIYDEFSSAQHYVVSSFVALLLSLRAL
jgi:GTPase SAR1 family protein